MSPCLKLLSTVLTYLFMVRKFKFMFHLDVKEIVKKTTPFILYFGTLRQTGKLSIYLNTVRSFQTAYSF